MMIIDRVSVSRKYLEIHLTKGLMNIRKEYGIEYSDKVQARLLTDWVAEHFYVQCKPRSDYWLIPTPQA